MWNDEGLRDPNKYYSQIIKMLKRQHNSFYYKLKRSLHWMNGTLQIEESYFIVMFLSQQ